MFGIPIQYLITLGVVAAIVGGLYWYGANEFKQGEDAAKVEIQAKTQETNKKIRTVKRKIRHETQSINRDVIIIELCANGWVRNADLCPK